MVGGDIVRTNDGEINKKLSEILQLFDSKLLLIYDIPTIYKTFKYIKSNSWVRMCRIYN